MPHGDVGSHGYKHCIGREEMVFQSSERRHATGSKLWGQYHLMRRRLLFTQASVGYSLQG